MITGTQIYNKALQDAQDAIRTRLLQNDLNTSERIGLALGSVAIEKLKK